MNRPSPTIWKQLSALYEQADELDDAALSSWLSQLRTSENPLLPELERMLSARTLVRQNDFLAEPPRLLQAAEPQVSDWGEGQHVGAYTLIRPLGTGGMAEVWLARRSDGAFERNVAIKLLYRDASRTRRHTFVQRFDRERDILASLNHRHIAKLLDAGVTGSEQPWIALEYVQGLALTDYCDSRHLDVAARVRLFLQVLLAVQYAHANLVIHRDLKPPNILVTEQGQVQLLDFGIAKILESDGKHSTETELTQVAGRPLTLLYASPEQTRGQALTTASDVYSLGVILYQLLCGETPYELKRESAAQLEHAILEIEPRAPSRRTLSEAVCLSRSISPAALGKTLGNDLDAIVLKCMHKLPESRYSSVEALGSDLQRWLDGKAVSAKPPSRAYYLRKFVARNQLGVVLGSSAIVALVGVAAVATVMGIQARHQSERAQASRDFLIDMFRQADPNLAGGQDMTARQLLATAKSSILNRMEQQALLRAELLRGLGIAQTNMSEYTQADETYGESVRQYQQMGRLELAASTMIDQADAVYQAGDNIRANLLLEAANHTARVSDLDPAAQGGFHEVKGLLALGSGDLVQSAKEAAATIEAYTRAYGPNHAKTLRAMMQLGRLQTRSGQFDQAKQLFDDVQLRSRHSNTLEPSDRVNFESAAANLEMLSGHLAVAQQRHDSVVALCEATLSPLGEDCVGLRQSQMVLLMNMGELDKAKEQLPKLLGSGSVGSPRRRAEAVVVASRLLVRLHQVTEHADFWNRLIALSKSSSDVKVPEYLKLQALLVRAEWSVLQGDTAAAMTILDDVGKRLGTGIGPERGLLGRAHVITAAAHFQSGNLALAADQMQQACDAFATANSPRSQLQLIQARVRLLQASMGQPAIAAQALRENIPLLKDDYGNTAPVIVDLEAKLQQLSRATTVQSPPAFKADLLL